MMRKLANFWRFDPLFLLGSQCSESFLSTSLDGYGRKQPCVLQRLGLVLPL